MKQQGLVGVKAAGMEAGDGFAHGRGGSGLGTGRADLIFLLATSVTLVKLHVL